MKLKFLSFILLLHFGLLQASNSKLAIIPVQNESALELQKDRYKKLLVASTLALNKPQTYKFEVIDISNDLISNLKNNKSIFPDVYHNAIRVKKDLVFDEDAYVFNYGHFSCCGPCSACCYFLCCWPLFCKCPSREDVQFRANKLKQSIDTELAKQNMYVSPMSILEIERDGEL